MEKGMGTHSSILAWRIPWTGAWWATVHGVLKSRTWLKWLSMQTSLLAWALDRHGFRVSKVETVIAVLQRDDNWTRLLEYVGQCLRAQYSVAVVHHLIKMTSWLWWPTRSCDILTRHVKNISVNARHYCDAVAFLVGKMSWFWVQGWTFVWRCWSDLSFLGFKSCSAPLDALDSWPVGFVLSQKKFFSCMRN